MLGVVLVLSDKVLHKVSKQLRDPYCPLVSESVSSAVALAVEHHLPDILAVLVLIVGDHVLCELVIGELLLYVYALFACREAVRGNSDSRSVNAHVVVIGAAVRDVHSLLDQTVLEQVQDQLRLALCLVVFAIMS